MTTSLDRKLARCQREIDAAKPKGLSFEEFEQGVFLPQSVFAVEVRQIKGAAKPASREVAPIGRPAEAAPPSVQKFKPGDKVRVKCDGRERFILLQRPDTENLFPGEWEVSITKGGERHDILTTDEIELVTPSPASETETEGWVDMRAGMPDLKAGEYEYRMKSHPLTTDRPTEMSIHSLFFVSEYSKYQYRVVKPS